MRTVRNNNVYHAADNTMQGDPFSSNTRCVDSSGQLWSPIYPYLEHLVEYYVNTDQAVQNVSHKVMSEDGMVSTAEGTSRLLENNEVTSKLQARYDQSEINKI